MEPNRLSPLRQALIRAVRTQIAMALLWDRQATRARTADDGEETARCRARQYAWLAAAKISAQPLRTNSP